VAGGGVGIRLKKKKKGGTLVILGGLKESQVERTEGG